MQKLINNFGRFIVTSKLALTNRRGEGAVGLAISILITVILGALLLAGLYILFGDVVMPKLTEKINEMFNYSGGI